MSDGLKRARAAALRTKPLTELQTRTLWILAMEPEVWKVAVVLSAVLRVKANTVTRQLLRLSDMQYVESRMIGRKQYRITAAGISALTERGER